MHLPKYLSIANFESDYQKDFEVWKKQYPNGSELDYLNELRGEYSQFIAADDWLGIVDKLDIRIEVRRKVLNSELEELRQDNNFEKLNYLYSSMDNGGFIDEEIDLYALYQLLDNRFECQFEEIEYNQKDFEELSLRELCKKYEVLDSPKIELNFFEKDRYFNNDKYKGIRYITGQSFILYPYVISDLVEYFYILETNDGYEDGYEIKYSIGFNERKYKDFQLLVKNMLILIDEKIENVKGNKPHQVILQNQNIQKMERSPKVETSSKENPAPQQITSIKLELNQTQIIYLFQQLVEKRYLRLNKNPALWNLISQYFVDVNDKPLKNIHQVKDRLINNREGKPKREADTIDEIVSFLDTFKD